MQQHSGIKILMPKAKFVSAQQVMAEYGFEISKLTGNSAILLKRETSCDLVIFKANQFTYGNSFTTLFITKKYYITIILHFSSKIKILCELNLIILASLALH